MYSVFQIFSVYSIVVFNCHIQLYIQLSRYLVFLYSFTSVSRTIFLIGRTLPGDTDSSSKPIARNSFVSDRSFVQILKKSTSFASSSAMITDAGVSIMIPISIFLSYAKPSSSSSALMPASQPSHPLKALQGKCMHVWSSPHLCDFLYNTDISYHLSAWPSLSKRPYYHIRLPGQESGTARDSSR